MKRILAAVDGSVQSHRAAAMAAQIARATGATLTLACVLRDFAAPLSLPRIVQSAWEESERGHARQVLEDAAKTCGTPVERKVLEGPDAADAIVAEAAQGYDLIVVGSRGRNAAARVLLGSVADRLLHTAGQSVLVVR